MTQQPETKSPAATAEIVAEQLRQPPEIWIGTADDYNAERQFGGWVAAGQLPEDLNADIRRVVDRTPPDLSADWAVHELRGFGLWEPGGNDDLEAINKVARGILQHGLAYAGLVAAVGADSIAAEPARFHSSYVGEWPSTTAFATDFVHESGWMARLQRLPESMQPFIMVDLERLIEVAQRDLTVVEHLDGIWVFDPRRW